MPTVFIAVQCFQCSTMQVKQRKKSSNKWSCVVCNEKQSVRKVFAQGFMAKDVRKYVQTFNMSRLVSDEQKEDSLMLDESQTLAPNPEEEEEEEEEIENQKKKKRTDWSEYIDLDREEDDQGDGLEPNVVTELPKELFKKPKLKGNYSATGFDHEDGGRLRKPVFGKTNINKNFNIIDKEPRTSTGTMVKANAGGGNGQNQLSDAYVEQVQGASKWRDYYKARDGDNVDHSFAYKGSSSMMTKLKRPMSKWNNCIDDGDNVDHSNAYKESSSMMAKVKKPISKWNEFMDGGDDLQLKSRIHYGEQIGEGTNHVAFQTTVTDEIVEDDVHPDFL